MLSDSAADGALLAAAQGGDQRAAHHLVHRHGGRLRAYALRVLGDRGTAEEIVQDVFSHLLRHGHEFRRDSALATWLHTVTLNRCRDVLRRVSFVAAMNAQPLVADMGDESPDPHQLAERREREAQLQRALAVLPADMRELIAFRFASGLSYEEIAEILGCATGTIASRLHRALRRLGQELRAVGFTEDGT